MNKLQNMLIQKGLSNREAQLSDLVSRGLSNKEIGHQLFITEKTVKFHLANIYKKLVIKSRAQLIVTCLPFMTFTPAVEGTEIYTQDQLDAMNEDQIYSLVDSLVGEALNFDLNRNLVNPYIDAGLKHNRLQRGLMLRRNRDGVSEVGWMLQKMIGEVLTDGKAAV